MRARWRSEGSFLAGRTAMDRSFERQVSLRTAAKSGDGSWANYPLCSDAVPRGGFVAEVGYVAKCAVATLTIDYRFFVFADTGAGIKGHRPTLSTMESRRTAAVMLGRYHVPHKRMPARLSAARRWDYLVRYLAHRAPRRCA